MTPLNESRGRISPIESRVESFEFIKAQIDVCHTQHSGCTVKAQSNGWKLTNLHVFDCSALTFSYVWRSGTEPHQLNDGLKSTGLLPQTLEDAITIITSIEYHYLWIDSICITQIDESDFFY